MSNYKILRFLISYVFDISVSRCSVGRKGKTEEQRRVTPEIMKPESNPEITMELEESVFAPEILYKDISLSLYPLKRPKDNHKLKTTPLELRNLTISRNHSHQSKLWGPFGTKN